jgi:hypothetical protein
MRDGANLFSMVASVKFLMIALFSAYSYEQPYYMNVLKTPESSNKD